MNRKTASNLGLISTTLATIHECTNRLKGNGVEPENETVILSLALTPEVALKKAFVTQAIWSDER